MEKKMETLGLFKGICRVKRGYIGMFRDNGKRKWKLLYYRGFRGFRV